MAYSDGFSTLTPQTDGHPKDRQAVSFEILIKKIVDACSIVLSW